MSEFAHRLTPDGRNRLDLAEPDYPIIVPNDAGEDMLTCNRSIRSKDRSDERHIFFQWTGGVYIEVGAVMHDPVEVINVYDYAQGVVDLDFEKGTFARKCDEWINDYGEANLYRDVSENWIYY